MADHKYDVIVLGCGPGGYGAAIKAAQNGLQTAVVDPDDMGGTCLNRGCVPTKLFLGATGVAAELGFQQRLRLVQGEARPDLAAMQNRKKTIVSSSRKAMRANLEKHGVRIHTGRGSLAGSTKIQVQSEILTCRHMIVATGSRSWQPPGLEPDHKYVLTSTDALELMEAPESLAIIGAGAVGLEIGQIFSRLGTRITLVEAMDRIAPMEDEHVSQELARYLKRERWSIKTGFRVEKVVKEGGGLLIAQDSGEEISSEKCLLAMGRLPNSADLHLENAGIQVYGPGWIKTDQNLLAAPNVYAIGDVNGRSLYAHAAGDQAEYAVDHILGRSQSSYPNNSMPGCIYGSMEVIRAGCCRQALLQSKADFKISSAGLASNTIAQAHALVQGIIKVYWTDDRVAGITGVGRGLSGLITLAQVIVEQKWTRQDARKYVFAHPSLDEALREALLAPQNQVPGALKSG